MRLTRSAWIWIKACTRWIPPPSTSACRCFPGRSFLWRVRAPCPLLHRAGKDPLAHQADWFPLLTPHHQTRGRDMAGFDQQRQHSKALGRGWRARAAPAGIHRNALTVAGAALESFWKCRSGTHQLPVSPASAMLAGHLNQACTIGACPLAVNMDRVSHFCVQATGWKPV